LKETGREKKDLTKGYIINRYDRILIFRESLKNLRHVPNDKAGEIACGLHAQLVSLGRMHSLFDPAFTSTEADESGRIPPFKPGKIRMIKVDLGRGTIEVPLFMRFLRRRVTARECAVCTDEIFDIDFRSVEEWLDFCTGFHGEWMWKIMMFPVKLGLECRHEIDFCTSCLEKHLTSQLDQYGRSKCDQLACPSDGCGRRLAYEEIKLYATTKTFEK
jgi:hypothetical protein